MIMSKRSSENTNDFTSDAISLEAYTYRNEPTVRIIPASTHRQWMLDTPFSFANRCLPLHVANQSGWALLNSRKVELVWDGRPEPDGIEITYPDGEPEHPHEKVVDNHFGQGIVTWIIPHVFRTSEGYNLLLRGPANMPKDGIAPLEGVIESDWLPVPVTMNWKLTRPGQRVTFEVDEPFAMIVPQQRGSLKAVQPRFRNVEDSLDLVRALIAYHFRRRARYVRELQKAQQANSTSPKWDGLYAKGMMPGWPVHERPASKLGLSEFTDLRDSSLSGLKLDF